MKTRPAFTDKEIGEVLQLGEIEAADRLVETRNQMKLLLPKLVFEQLRSLGRKSVSYQIICGQVAVRSLCGRTTREYLDERDRLMRQERTYARAAREALQHAATYEKTASADDGMKARILNAMSSRFHENVRDANAVVLASAASESAISSLLHAQLKRDAALKDGKLPEPDCVVPAGACDAGGGGSGSCLELVPLEPVPPASLLGGGGGGASDDAAAPAPILRPRDGLDFLDW